jgi:Ca-activated chloride channel family protein
VKSGTYLSVLGFGRGNLRRRHDAGARAEPATARPPISTPLNEAQKVLVEELTGSSLFPIADDVKFQVEWNPDRRSPNTA